MMTNRQSPNAAAVQGFLSQLSSLQKDGVGLALRALSADDILVHKAEQMLEFDARLVLLERLLLARSVPEDLSAGLDAALTHARKLAQYRDDLVALSAENASVKHLHTTRQVNSYTRQALELTSFMTGFAKRLKSQT